MAMNRNRLFFAALCCAGFGVLAGCGGNNTSKVAGTVTLDGKPTAGATVTFVPVEEAAGRRLASGVTNADGHFRLTTFNTNDGALPGEYHVTVTLVERPEKTYDSGLAREGHGMKYMDSNRNKAPEVQRKIAAETRKNTHSLIPEVYGDAKRTPLRQTVPTKGDVQLELDNKVR
jgi:hypothetical protein